MKKSKKKPIEIAYPGYGKREIKPLPAVSPLPWRYDADKQIISDECRNGVFFHNVVAATKSIRHEADGNFIVHAVNNHAALFNMLERVYYAEFDFCQWPSANEIESVLQNAKEE